MAPVAHWSPDHYYRAVVAARIAWARSQPQLSIDGLEGADAGTTSLVASAPSSPNDGLAAGDETGPSDRVPGGRGEDRSPAASPPSPHADAARTSGTHSSGERGGGLDNPTTRETPWA